MKFNRDVYRWGFVDRANDEIEVAHGLVEIIYKDGTVAEIEVEEIKHRHSPPHPRRSEGG